MHDISSVTAVPLAAVALQAAASTPQETLSRKTLKFRAKTGHGDDGELGMKVLGITVDGTRKRLARRSFREKTNVLT